MTKVYAFDIDHTMDWTWQGREPANPGPVTIHMLERLLDEGDIVGFCGNHTRVGDFLKQSPEWGQKASFFWPGGDWGPKHIFLIGLKGVLLCASEFILVGNVLGVSGTSDDAGEAARAGWRFIKESDFAAGVR